MNKIKFKKFENINFIVLYINYKYIIINKNINKIEHGILNYDEYLRIEFDSSFDFSGLLSIVDSTKININHVFDYKSKLIDISFKNKGKLVIIYKIENIDTY